MRKMFTLGALVGFLPLLALAGHAQPKPTPTIKPHTSRLTGSVLCIRQHERNGHIVRIDFPSGKETVLTRNSALYFGAVFSPSGKQIAFIATSYPPRGSSSPPAPYKLFIMNRDGSGVRTLTHWPGSSFNPSFLDESHIIFSRPMKTPANKKGMALWTVDTGGRHLRQLTHGPNDTNPAVGPAKRVVFAGRRLGGSEIYVMNSDGTQIRRVTRNSSIEQSPRFSPDGRRIVFVSKRSNSFEIYSINLDGSDERRLTNDSFMDTSPCYSPGGDKIMYQSIRGNSAQLFVMNLDGSGQTQVTSPPANHVYLDWK